VKKPVSKFAFRIQPAALQSGPPAMVEKAAIPALKYLGFTDDAMMVF
jgi:hypothetical protein